MEHNIRMRAIGRLDGLPDSVRADLAEAVGVTSVNDGLLVNLAINYSGRAEIADAVNDLIAQAANEGCASELRIDEEAIASRLYTAGLPDPDLLIRTSGELRISNFLLWQIAYSEIYVTATLWPDFRLGDLLEAILEYQKRDRRFGGLNLDRKVERDSGARLMEALGTSSK
jgi:undecaprenyl diphosphate synthase